MKLTREQAITEHRKMWNWIADKTEERGEKVKKENYFRENGITDDVCSLCYCCEFARQLMYLSHYTTKKCVFCPIKWGDNANARCSNDGKDSLGIYSKWIASSIGNDYNSSAQLAREIAYLPEKPNSEIIRAAFKDAEEHYDVDELDFYTTLVDCGFTTDDVRECMGDEPADHMQQFCEKHGLI